jgi:uncharacterized protein (TIGR02611 family)
MEKLKLKWLKTPKPARQIIIFVIGIVVIAAGIAMLVLPGPGWAAIFLGLAILATEFERAEKVRGAVVRRFRDTIKKAFPPSKR